MSNCIDVAVSQWSVLLYISDTDITINKRECIYKKKICHIFNPELISVQSVFHNWCTKSHCMYYSVVRIAHIKEGQNKLKS